MPTEDARQLGDGSGKELELEVVVDDAADDQEGGGALQLDGDIADDEEVISPVEALVARAADVVIAQGSTAGEMIEPRVLRVLKGINKAVYVELKSKLGHLLVTLRMARRMRNAPLEESTTAKIKSEVQAKLGSAFVQVATAETMLSNPDGGYHLKSAAAAIADAPVAFAASKKTPEDVAKACRDALAIRDLLAATRTSEGVLRERLETRIFAAIEERCHSMKCFIACGHRCFAMEPKDLPALKEVIQALSDELDVFVLVASLRALNISYRPREGDTRVQSDECGGHILFYDKKKAATETNGFLHDIKWDFDKER